MKKILFVSLLFLSFMNICNASTVKGKVYCPDNDEPVNLRPSVNVAANDSLVCNSEVEVLNTNAGTNSSSGCTGSFYQVRQGIKTGYACSDFIKITETPLDESEGKVLCIEDTSPLFMFRDLNRTDKINNGGLSCNTKVKILNTNAGKDGRGTCATSLYKIKYGNDEGYVCGTYIEKTKANIDIDFNTPDLKKYREELSKIFPESYLDDLVKLHTLYPNWKFLPFSSNLDFNYILNKEYDGYYK